MRQKVDRLCCKKEPRPNLSNFSLNINLSGNEEPGLGYQDIRILFEIKPWLFLGFLYCGFSLQCFYSSLYCLLVLPNPNVRSQETAAVLVEVLIAGGGARCCNKINLIFGGPDIRQKHWASLSKSYFINVWANFIQSFQTLCLCYMNKYGRFQLRW